MAELMLASQRDHEDIVNALLHSNANVNLATVSRHCTSCNIVVFY